MFKEILDPVNNQFYSIFSKKGIKLLKQYVKLYNGGSNEPLLPSSNNSNNSSNVNLDKIKLWMNFLTNKEGFVKNIDNIIQSIIEIKQLMKNYNICCECKDITEDNCFINNLTLPFFGSEFNGVNLNNPDRFLELFIGKLLRIKYKEAGENNGIENWNKYPGPYFPKKDEQFSKTLNSHDWLKYQNNEHANFLIATKYKFNNKMLNESVPAPKAGANTNRFYFNLLNALRRNFYGVQKFLLKNEHNRLKNIIDTKIKVNLDIITDALLKKKTGDPTEQEKIIINEINSTKSTVSKEYDKYRKEKLKLFYKAWKENHNLTIKQWEEDTNFKFESEKMEKIKKNMEQLKNWIFFLISDDFVGTINKIIVNVNKIKKLMKDKELLCNKKDNDGNCLEENLTMPLLGSVFNGAILNNPEKFLDIFINKLINIKYNDKVAENNGIDRWNKYPGLSIVGENLKNINKKSTNPQNCCQYMSNSNKQTKCSNQVETIGPYSKDYKICASDIFKYILDSEKWNNFIQSIEGQKLWASEFKYTSKVNTENTENTEKKYAPKASADSNRFYFNLLNALRRNLNNIQVPMLTNENENEKKLKVIIDKKDVTKEELQNAIEEAKKNGVKDNSPLMLKAHEKISKLEYQDALKIANNSNTLLSNPAIEREDSTNDISSNVNNPPLPMSQR